MTKIVIKPRIIAGPSNPPPQDSPSPEDTAADVGDDGEDESQAMDVDEPEEGGDDEDGEEVEETEVAEPAVLTKRPRGRPRGSGRGGASTPRPTARGRGRGKGKARGRPRKGGGEDEEDGEYGDGEDGGGLEEVVQSAGPVGGGKPFRTIQGQVYVIDGDEFVTDDDAKGDAKIDKWGNLLGGRVFKAATFSLPNRHPNRQYMLAIDAARTSGFRDSLYYFRRNLLAFKLNATQAEKDYLISEGKLGSHLRTRSVTLVTARSAFKLHGSKMLIDGRWVTDDYYEDKVLAEITERGLKPGELVGELPDPNAAHHNTELSALNSNAAANAAKNERGAGGGGGMGLYRAGGPTTIFGGSGWGPYSDGPLNAVRKSVLSRDGVTEENWMWMMATRVSEATEGWTKLRKESVKVVEGVQDLPMMGGAPLPLAQRYLYPNGTDGEPGLGAYEPHLNVVNYRPDTQPTTARWEVVPETAAQSKRRVLGGTKVGNGAWALAYVDTIMTFPEPGAEKRSEDALARERLWREAMESGIEPIEFP